MSQSETSNYSEELNQYFQVFGTMVDIGCADLKFLFQFDNSSFNRIIGIDIKISIDPFQDYLDFKHPDLLTVNYSQIEREFYRKYKFIENDILNFQMKKRSFGFIFCKHVIHFIPHNLQMQLIDDLYHALVYKGILYIKINHSLNTIYQDTSKVSKISDNCFIEVKNKNKTHYLLHPDELIQIIRTKFDPEFIDKDDKSVTTIIRKNQ